VIEAVTMEAKQAEARWEKMMLAIEKLTGKVDAMEEERTLFRKQMEETGKAVSLLRLEAMARDMDRYGKEEAGERDNRNSQNRECTEVERRVLGNWTEMGNNCNNIYQGCPSQSLEEQIQPFGSYNVKIISTSTGSLIFLSPLWRLSTLKVLQHDGCR
jgi:hypothetical protein